MSPFEYSQSTLNWIKAAEEREIESHQEYLRREKESKRIPDYKKLEETFFAIRNEVNNAESQFDMYSYATSIWPEFVEELLRIIKEKSDVSIIQIQ